MKLKSYQKYSRIIDFGNRKGIDNVAFGMVAETKCLLALWHRIANFSRIRTSEQIELDKWYHVAFVLKNLTGFIFINAIQIMSEIFLTPLPKILLVKATGIRIQMQMLLMMK